MLRVMFGRRLGFWLIWFIVKIIVFKWWNFCFMLRVLYLGGLFLLMFFVWIGKRFLMIIFGLIFGGGNVVLMWCVCLFDLLWWVRLLEGVVMFNNDRRNKVMLMNYLKMFLLIDWWEGNLLKFGSIVVCNMIKFE